MSEEHTRLMVEQLKVLQDIKGWAQTTAVLVFVLLCVVIISGYRAGLGPS
jgi:hypothetical protein